MKKLLRDYLSDFLLLAGCGCILYGIAQLSLIATWIVGGMMLTGLAALIAFDKNAGG